MYTGQLVFSQVTDHLPMHTFRRCVQRYQGERYVKRFRCFDQYLSMAFAQLTYRESLRDIEACLRAHQSKLYHMGIRSRVVQPGPRRGAGEGRRGGNGRRATVVTSNGSDCCAVGAGPGASNCRPGTSAG